ncbi:MAG TPA: hypothetical protein PK400_06070 [Phycisphaerales bacterium]|nr:hypothetical protein [Phycisphaerales bacterium]HRQ76219.1 hypothetical protein [Phycisphaerales bacterium]
MTTVAFLIAANMLKDHPQARSDYWELDREYEPMHAACAARGIRLQQVIWDDSSLDPTSYDAFVIGTTWDYPERPADFMRTLASLSAHKPLFNPLAVVQWNLSKAYLRDLASRGAATIPTLWRARADAMTIAAAFDELGTDEVVIKPEVGAGAWRQARLKRGEPLPPANTLPPDRCMIQPFLPAILDEGEYSFIFFNGNFSHCARKMAANGDYRIQAMFGGHEVTHDPAETEIALARRTLDAIDEPLLYARVDMIRNSTGNLAVMEVELIEPYLYPDQGRMMGEHFAAALEAMLNRST